MLARILGYVRSHHLALLALFVALGGTAYAANTVGSADVINNSLQSVDLKDNAAVKSSDVVNDEITAADLAGVGFQEARTFRLQTGGGIVSRDLFDIGGVHLTSFCDNEGSHTTAGIEPVVQAAGPVMVSYDNPSPISLQPFDAQFVGILNAPAAGGTDAEQGSFAILADTSASGVLGLRVNPAQGRCFITINALG